MFHLISELNYQHHFFTAVIWFGSPYKDPSLLAVVGKQKESCLLFSVSYTGIQSVGEITSIHIPTSFFCQYLAPLRRCHLWAKVIHVTSNSPNKRHSGDLVNKLTFIFYKAWIRPFLLWWISNILKPEPVLVKIQKLKCSADDKIWNLVFKKYNCQSFEVFVKSTDIQRNPQQLTECSIRSNKRSHHLLPSQLYIEVFNI